jgi:hypothetical protein
MKICTLGSRRLIEGLVSGSSYQEVQLSGGPVIRQVLITTAANNSVLLFPNMPK